MKDIYYVNSAGVRLNLLEPPYLLQTGNFFDTEWGYDYVGSSSGGGIITSFRKDLEERDMTLSIINYGNGSFEDAVDKFADVTGYDISHHSPGKLYVGEFYLRCFITATRKAEWESESSYLDNKVTLTTEYPMWIEEDMQQFRKAVANEPRNEYLDFPFGFPFDFLGGVSGVGYLENRENTPCNFRMIIYGPCTHPRIIITDHIYEVITKLSAGEYLVVDSREGTVSRVRNNGSTVNEFDNRNKKSSIFDKIPAGNNMVSWDGSFGFDIIQYNERDEPKWS